ncbi:hypothetical protein A8U91_04627 [Halomonas elongata]|uniref:Uncharacterized protein n=1 Tax=Halomonas elongata TaxID=2746 RepID=A0A1B8P019_HALEL|nr:hypothetical protein A8U91_04627 [Halomonas elongata]
MRQDALNAAVIGIVVAANQLQRLVEAGFIQLLFFLEQRQLDLFQHQAHALAQVGFLLRRDQGLQRLVVLAHRDQVLELRADLGQLLLPAAGRRLLDGGVAGYLLDILGQGAPGDLLLLGIERQEQAGAIDARTDRNAASSEAISRRTGINAGLSASLSRASAVRSSAAAPSTSRSSCRRWLARRSR